MPAKKRPRKKTEHQLMLQRERTRRTREREALGYKSFRVDVRRKLIEDMVNSGRLTPEQGDDDAHVAIELAAMIEERGKFL